MPEYKRLTSFTVMRGVLVGASRIIRAWIVQDLAKKLVCIERERIRVSMLHLKFGHHACQIDIPGFDIFSFLGLRLVRLRHSKR